MSDKATKSCRVCAVDIPEAAIKCTACDSYQDWRGGIRIGATTMSLIVALVALTPAAIKGLTGLVTPQDSHIVLGRPIWQRGHYIQFVSNTGIRPGAVTGGILYRGRRQPKGQRTLPEELYGLELEDAPKGALIVEPGKSLLVRFRLTDSRPATKPLPAGVDAACGLGTATTSFRGDQTVPSFDIDCLEMTLVISSPNPPLIQGGVAEQAPGGQTAPK